MKNKILQRKTIKVYMPCNFKTGIVGFWVDDKGKLYRDNILIQSVNIYQYNRIKASLFKGGEKAIFYIENNNAIIEDKEGITILKEKKTFLHDAINENQIKEYCAIYGGCTVFKAEGSFIVEAWV